MTSRWMVLVLAFAWFATASAQDARPLTERLKMQQELDQQRQHRQKTLRDLQHELLRQEILQADTRLFDAFNAKDIATLRTMFTDDLEFYQDDEGLAGYARTIDDFTAMFAQPVHITRELVPGSVEVRPINGYGAMEIGAHRFCHVEDGKPDCGTFQFIHVWRMDGGHWKIARVVSYGHKLAP